MKKLIFYAYAKKFLEGIENGNEILENPAVDFTKRAKAGEFDELSDYDYNELLACCEDASSFWEKSATAPAAKLFGNVLKFAEVNDTKMMHMAMRLLGWNPDDIDSMEKRAKAEAIDDAPHYTMSTTTFVIYFTKILKGLAGNNKFLYSPMAKFMKLQRMGMLDNLAPEIREKLKAYCESASELWNNKRMDSCARLLMNILRYYKLSDYTYDWLIDVLNNGEFEIDLQDDEEAYVRQYITEGMIAEGYWTEDSHVCEHIEEEHFAEYFKEDLEISARQQWADGLDNGGNNIREYIKPSIRKFYSKESEYYWNCVQNTVYNQANIVQMHCMQESFFDGANKLDEEIYTFEEILDRGSKIENWKPKEIYTYVKKQIYGQEDAVKAASMLLYNHLRGHKRNVLFLGPTGCGKTEIWRVLSQLYKNVRIIDSTRITQEGWKGEYKLQNIFDGFSEEEAERSILVFDEFDKLCEPAYGSNGTNYSAAIQNELLKFIEGSEIECKNEKEKSKVKRINTSKISFVFCGSFETLMNEKNTKERSLGFGANVEKKNTFAQYEKEITPEDLAANGNVRREICGRINQIVKLKELTAEDYEKMLDMSSLSPITALEKEYSLKLTLNEETRKRIAQKAAENKMGVRYIYSKLQELLDDEMFKEDGKDLYSLEIRE